MDYIPETLNKVMKTYLKMKQMVPPLLVKLYSYKNTSLVSMVEPEFLQSSFIRFEEG